MKNKTFIIFDLEATCYDRNDSNKPDNFSNEIIEIGAYKVNSNGDILSEFSKFVKPKNHPVISEFCNELTTICQGDIDTADSAKTVIAEFFEWSGDSTFVSWGLYDKKQLRRDLELNGLDIELINDDNHISIKHEYAKWNGLPKRGIGLGRALNKENLTFKGTAHRGIDDARNILEIFKIYKDKF